MESQSPTPVFIFSLPRSGSTLLQKILAAHPAVATSSEPWILLPIIMARRPGAIYATYRHENVVRAIDDFASSLDGGVASFDDAVHDFVLELYRRSSSPGVAYFVDKTPRYHLIADEVMHLFPEAKCIFLWRNPLSVAASMIRTWGAGHWNLFRHRVDLEQGLPNLVETFRAHESEVIAVRYEDLVRDPSSSAKRLFDHLKLDFDPDILSQFANVRLDGMGDRKGEKLGSHISTSSINALEDVISSPLRRAWLHRYIDRIGDERLTAMGYHKATLHRSLKVLDSSNRSVASDLFRMSYGLMYQGFDKMVEWRSRRYLHNMGEKIPAVNSCVPAGEDLRRSLRR